MQCDTLFIILIRQAEFLRDALSVAVKNKLMPVFHASSPVIDHGYRLVDPQLL